MNGAYRGRAERWASADDPWSANHHSWLGSDQWSARESANSSSTAAACRRQELAWQRYRAASLLGRSLSGQKKYAAAEPLLLEGVRGMDARKEQIAVPDRYHLERAREWLVQLYEAWGKPAQAAE